MRLQPGERLVRSTQLRKDSHAKDLSPRVIRDLYLTDWGGRLFMFENFNGTPLSTLLSLTMRRAEFTGNGEFAAFARKVCGLEQACDSKSEYEATADYAKAQDTGRRVDEKVRIQAAE